MRAAEQPTIIHSIEEEEAPGSVDQVHRLMLNQRAIMQAFSDHAALLQQNITATKMVLELLGVDQTGSVQV